MSSRADPTARRDAVLESALLTFARFGYRRTSMEEVAGAARISRPGLYFLFSSKESLFRAAVDRSLALDLEAVERILADGSRPLDQRVLGAFDRWAGRYVGPMAREIAAVIDDNPDLLGSVVETAPQRFEKLATDAIAAGSDRATARRMARTLVSTSIGVKHQVGTRAAYRRRMAVAVGLVLA